VKVYPIGYSRLGARERIDELTKQNNVLLMDTRLKPYSWRVDFRQAELKAKYGNTYHWCGKHLGNVNYQGGPIKLADPNTGIQGLIGYIKAGYDLILLCQCVMLDDCHVKEVCRLLVEKMPEVEVMKFEQSGQAQADTIPCFSTRPPYGSWLANPQRFIDIGLPPKTIENRDKDFTGGYRGPVLIHQSKTFEHDAIDYWYGQMPGIEKIFSMEQEGYPHGCFVGQADIVDVVTESEDPWFVGDYGIVLANARPLDPIPYKGQLGLFSIPRSILDQPRQTMPVAQRTKSKRSTLDEDIKELAEVFEGGRMIICQRSGPGKGCTMTWAPGDRCSLNSTPAVITAAKMEGLKQFVRIRVAMDAPLLGRKLISDHPKWLDGTWLKPRGTIIPEFGEFE
jgi:hypothetical protein